MADTLRIAVIGLGYVGLPLAVALAGRHDVVGYDVDTSRIDELRLGNDRTGEVPTARLTDSSLAVSDDIATIRGCGMYIVTVPTPVDAAKKPDLSALRAASRAVGGVIGKGAVVVFESTVYPGVTEDVCGPEIEKASDLVCGRDFFLGYSPERINPGDREHTIDRITKVIAGQTPEVTAMLERVYGAITAGGVFVATDIRTAEAAKVIENAQRDINIAFINEVATIFQKMGLSVHDVLEAAGTKWNFLQFTPGLVGGHCIGIDPFYLAHAAMAVGHHPEIILAGRRINDSMGGHIAEGVLRELARGGFGAGARVLLLGLTFKENVPDLRNTRVVDIVSALADRGIEVAVHDPMADAAEAKTLYGIELLPSLDGGSGFHALIGAVPHQEYCKFTAANFEKLVRPGGVVADIKGMWRHIDGPDGYVRWQL